MNGAGKKVIVGLSGGVDSSVAALLLKEQGYLVEGLFMKNWEEDDTDNYCSASLDIKDAQSVCEKLAIPFHTVNFSEEYWNQVFEHCLTEYQQGRTPNPDILCNREIKFKAFLNHAIALGADFIATGHYAKKDSTEETPYALYKAKDLTKDQTYFLYTLTQQALSKTLFPLGDLDKTAVRALAKQAGFDNHLKKDSTGICFIGERKFKTFLQRYLPAQPGDIESLQGEKLGQHEGLMFYTLGQRQGLKIGGRRNSSGAPWYVVKKELSRNVLIVAEGGEHQNLYAECLQAQDVHWISGSAPSTGPFLCQAKIRYRQNDVPCEVSLQENHCHVTFKTPERAITPGQSIVFYQQNVCLGGGIIL